MWGCMGAGMYVWWSGRRCVLSGAEKVGRYPCTERTERTERMMYGVDVMRLRMENAINVQTDGGVRGRGSHPGRRRCGL